MRLLEALRGRFSVEAAAVGLAIGLAIAGCQGPDEYFFNFDGGSPGAAGSSSPGSAGTTGAGGTTGTGGATGVGGTGGGVLGTAGARGGAGGGGGSSAGSIGPGTGGGSAGATGTGGAGGGAGASGGRGGASGSGGRGGASGSTGGSTTGTGGGAGTGGASGGRGGASGSGGRGGASGSTGGSTTGTGGMGGASGGRGGASGGRGGAGGGAVDQLQVVARCQPGTSAQEVKVTFQVMNPGSTAKQWSDIKVRYYYTPSMQTVPTVNFDYVAPPRSASMLTSTATTSYVEVGFVAGSGTVAAFDTITGSGEIQLRFFNFSTTTWNTSQDDDHSYRSCAGVTNMNAYADRLTMPAYYQGDLAWGEEP
jgi:hypothetical protein